MLQRLGKKCKMYAAAKDQKSLPVEIVRIDTDCGSIDQISYSVIGSKKRHLCKKCVMMCYV